MLALGALNRHGVLHQKAEGQDYGNSEKQLGDGKQEKITTRKVSEVFPLCLCSRAVNFSFQKYPPSPFHGTAQSTGKGWQELKTPHLSYSGPLIRALLTNRGRVSGPLQPHQIPTCLLNPDTSLMIRVETFHCLPMAVPRPRQGFSVRWDRKIKRYHKGACLSQNLQKVIES